MSNQAEEFFRIHGEPKPRASSAREPPSTGSACSPWPKRSCPATTCCEGWTSAASPSVHWRGSKALPTTRRSPPSKPPLARCAR